MSQCGCCQASSFRSVWVRVKCSDGHRDTVSVLVPSSCNCLQCGATNHQARDQVRQGGRSSFYISYLKEDAQVVGGSKTDSLDVYYAPRKGQVSINDIFGDGNE